MKSTLCARCVGKVEKIPYNIPYRYIKENEYLPACEDCGKPAQFRSSLKEKLFGEDNRFQHLGES